MPGGRRRTIRGSRAQAVVLQGRGALLDHALDEPPVEWATAAHQSNWEREQPAARYGGVVRPRRLGEMLGRRRPWRSGETPITAAVPAWWRAPCPTSVLADGRLPQPAPLCPGAEARAQTEPAVVVLDGVLVLLAIHLGTSATPIQKPPVGLRHPEPPSKSTLVRASSVTTAWHRSGVLCGSNGLTVPGPESAPTTRSTPTASPSSRGPRSARWPPQPGSTPPSAPVQARRQPPLLEPVQPLRRRVQSVHQVRARVQIPGQPDPASPVAVGSSAPRGTGPTEGVPLTYRQPTA